MVKLLSPLLALALAACAGGPPPPASSPWLVPSEGQKDVASGTPLERFFPLVDGMVYTYLSVNEVGEQGLLVARVHRTDPKHGELRFPTGSKVFEYAPDGVVLKGRGADSYVLKAPLDVGTTWVGEHGGKTRVLSVTAGADTPAGHYDGCVQTLEERLGDRPIRYSTTFCPAVGVVSLEVATGANYERAQLKTYAPPMRMRPDGTDRLPAGGAEGMPSQ
ncbi:Hypothetical protein A7982_08929 [Minicystis rosea]|nr:Hypothetical protein A7982_08929 [Minicystis rosea]